MTSLAKQLQRLALPHTQAILGEDKKKASLLFDHKEAANIDRETFHALGILMSFLLYPLPPARMYAGIIIVHLSIVPFVVGRIF